MVSYDVVRLVEAASILGCSQAAVRRYVLAERLASGPHGQKETFSRTEVEGLAVEVYDWRKHIRDGESYWLTGQRAADALGVNRARLNQLADRGFVPYETHRDGTRLYRREQLEVVAKARQARYRGNKLKGAPSAASRK